jgi:preprotein translocase subunit YajC
MEKEKEEEKEEENRELKIGDEITLGGKSGVLVDVSADKFRVNWEDGTWDWVRQEESGIAILKS